MNVPVICGECGAAMALKSSKYGQFWGCTRWPACSGSHGAHPDGNPLGIPADSATKQARIRAHAVFDAAWKAKGLKRKQAYRWLQELTGLSPHDAHISRFGAEQCAALISRLEARP